MHGVGENGRKKHADNTLLAVLLEPRGAKESSSVAAHAALHDVLGSGEEDRVGGAGVRRLHGLEGLGQAVEERGGVVG